MTKRTHIRPEGTRSLADCQVQAANEAGLTQGKIPTRAETKRIWERAAELAREAGNITAARHCEGEVSRMFLMEILPPRDRRGFH